LLIEKLVLDIVPVLDNFRSATQHVPPEQAQSPWVVGIQYIEKQLEAVLVDNGIQMIEVKEGDVFDPTVHEAVGQTAHTEHHSAKKESREVALEKEEMLNIVSKVVQKGYKFGDRVIRPARVIVN
jgi:molecular chaperone GrpE